MNQEHLDAYIHDYQEAVKEHGAFSSHFDVECAAHFLLVLAAEPDTTNSQKLQILAALTTPYEVIGRLYASFDETFSQDQLAYILKNQYEETTVRKTALYLSLTPDPENINTFSLFSKMDINTDIYRDIDSAKLYLQTLSHHSIRSRNADLLVNYPQTLIFWTKKENWSRVPNEMKDAFLHRYFFQNNSSSKMLPFISEDVQQSIIANMSAWDVNALNTHHELAAFIGFSSANETEKNKAALRLFQTPEAQNFVNAGPYFSVGTNFSLCIASAAQQILNSDITTESDKKTALRFALRDDGNTFGWYWTDKVQKLTPEQQLIAYDLITERKTLPEIVAMGNDAQNTAIELAASASSTHLVYMITNNNFWTRYFSPFDELRGAVSEEYLKTPFSQKALAKFIENADVTFTDVYKYLEMLGNTNFNKQKLLEVAETARTSQRRNWKKWERELEKAKANKKKFDAGQWVSHSGRPFRDHTAIIKKQADESYEKVSKLTDFINQTKKAIEETSIANKEQATQRTPSVKEQIKTARSELNKKATELNKPTLIPQTDIGTLAAKFQSGMELSEEEKTTLGSAIKSLPFASNKQAKHGFSRSENMTNSDGTYNFAYILEKRAAVSDTQKKQLLNILYPKTKSPKNPAPTSVI